MQAFRQASKWLHLALAVLFAAITVAQAQAMTIACVSPLAQSAAIPQIHHHADDAHTSNHGHDGQPASDATHDPTICHDMSCCVALGPARVAAPAVAFVSLGIVAAAPARTMLPAIPEPADPPPRLQA